MKKRLLPFFAVLSILSLSAFLPVPAVQGNKMSLQVFDLEDWLIDKPTFDRMYAFYANCRGNECKTFKKSKRNSQVREEIEKTYTIVSEDKFMGRYTDDDMPRYKKARGINDEEERGNVKGFSTIIIRYEVVPKEGLFQAPLHFLYSDEFTICPPPDSPPCS